jgi:RNA polymerase sigma factor (sigma-70 family)
MHARPFTESKAKNAPDPELFAAIVDGELWPLGILFDRYHEPVRQFLLRATARGADVDDLVQETFLTASRAADAYDGRASARPFLIGVAAQLVRRRRRTMARVRAMLVGVSIAPAPGPPTPEDNVSAADETRAVRAAIARLADEQRLLLVMIEYEGLSGPEVARVLDVPVGTVWRRLHDARAALRTTMIRGRT